MNPESIIDVVRAWFEGDVTMFEACTQEPEVAWPAILEVLRHDLTEEQIALLAAGPLETLLSWHGPHFIERVEQEATHNPRFRRLLGGVWQSDMSPEIWQRIESARGEAW